MKFKTSFVTVLVALLSLHLVPASVFAAGHISPDGRPNYAPFFPYVHRTNIVVADIDRALTIYRDILGFKVAFNIPIRSAGIVHDTFGIEDDVKMRIAMLSVGEKDERGKIQRPIGLSEVPGYEAPDRDTYDTAMIIEINPEDEDIQELYQRLSAKGLKMGRLMDLPIPERTEFAFTDFDGHRIIIMQLPWVPRITE